MKNIKMYQVDAFTDTLFKGNPAAVCILEKPLSKELMQQIAMENNLAETAFITPNGSDFNIKWFTPAVEIDLCGHATLASAYVLFEKYGYSQNLINFHSNSGLLSVRKSQKKSQELLTLNFPTAILTPVTPPKGFLEALGCPEDKVLDLQKSHDNDYLVLLESQKAVMEVSPDFRELAKINARGVIVTSQGEQKDKPLNNLATDQNKTESEPTEVVSRFFCPACGIDEDPVTGSAHTKLIPYWAKKLQKNTFIAEQISKRGGKLWCEFLNERVEMSGKAYLYLEGEIFI